MLVVSVACVRLANISGGRAMIIETYCGYTLNLARFTCINRHKMYFAALFTSLPPVYSGKWRSSGTYGKESILLLRLYRESLVPFEVCA
jgi:hypothetical protein